MARPVWKGAIAFGLVTIPVSMYSAVERRNDISFRLLHDKDKSPIDYRRFCQAENVEVEWKDIVKGYEYAKGEFVVVTEDDFARARSAATEIVDIRDFVPAASIGPAYYDAPYWLEPTKQGRKGYALLREALERSGRVGIGSFVMRQREYLAALRPHGEALMLTTLRFADEIRTATDLDLPADARADKRELDLALQLVQTLAGDWQPDKYHDTYREALRRTIEDKVEGKETAAPPPARPPKVVDLVEALQASLAAPRKAPAPAPSRRAARGRAAGGRRRASGRSSAA